MMKEILIHRPGLNRLFESSSVSEYLAPAFNWNPGNMPYRSSLCSILLRELISLNKLNKNEEMLLKKQLNFSWVVQTGEHISIPRMRSRPTEKKCPNGLVSPWHNSMVFQGVVYWAAMNLDRGYSYSIEMATGRTPLNNPLSGAYLEISPDINLIRLVPAKWHQTPQIFIPAVNGEVLENLRRLLIINKHCLSEKMFIYWRDTINYMSGQNNEFVNQIALIHSSIMSSTMPIRQLTVESENIAVKFLIELFDDRNSLIYQIFSNKWLLETFIKQFSGIATGWNIGETPFYNVDCSGKFPRLNEYRGDLQPAKLKILLEQGLVYPKGVLKFFCFMVEGGLLSIGGCCQNEYCSRIKEKAVNVLEQLGENIRATALSAMPTEITTIAPCWGLKNNNSELINVLDCLEKPLNIKEMKDILRLSGADALKNAASVLYPFLTGKNFPCQE